MERNIILGTDWWTDCDDIAAARIVCRAHRKGLWRFRGAVLDACMEYSAPSLNAFLGSEGLPDVPITVDLDATDFTGTLSKYQENMTKALPHQIPRNVETPRPLPFLKSLLSACPDDSAELIEIGFP